MKFEVGKSYNGFTLTDEKEIKEVNSIGRLFTHDKTGARLFALENDDDNKVFSISFRTPPEDSTGTPHILEHSVLCGSKKFPVKEPFVELAKGSLNTFLNAMTFSDKTMYPVASKNEKDFFNLMDVYLDAVFYPDIYKYPEIFMQEGWHYELDDKDGEISYKGVVYNEMKGAFSAPESILFRKIQQTLFPDTPYGKESGGDPEDIPNLTLEQFLSFHKKYYHPSNSYIYLYGDGNLLKELKFINENYLKNFDRIEIDSSIPLQKPFDKMNEVTEYYPISPDEDEEHKTFLSLNFKTGKSTCTETYLAMQILEHMLLETPAAPLKKALLDAGIGKDVFGIFDNSILEPVFSIVVKNSDENKREDFKKVVFDTLQSLVKDGIDKKLIEASINIKEFELREADHGGAPKGLIYNIEAMDSWLYGEDPCMHLQYEETLTKIKSALKTRYFEDMIQKYLLDNTHSSLITLKPQKGLSERKSKEVKDELKKYKEGLSEKELEEIIKKTQKLKKRQTEPDSPENLAKIPLLSLDDIEKKAEELPIVKNQELGIDTLHHNVFTNKIVYMSMIFDSTVVEQELLPYISLLTDVLGKVSCEKYDYTELTNEINIHTGGIQFNIGAFEENGDPEKYYPKFIVKSKAVAEKLPELADILCQIIKSTKFTETKRIREIIQEIKSRLEMRIFDEGHVAAGKRVYSYFSPSGRYIEELSGISYYKFIAGLEKELSNDKEAAFHIEENLYEVYKRIFNKKNLIISVTCEDEDYNSFKKVLPDIDKCIGNTDYETHEYKFDLNKENEGLLTQGKVQYVAKGYNFMKLGYDYTGSLKVLRTIEGYDYLWNNVRVQGGAYGAFARFDRNGNMFFASYRDPNLKETLNVYDEAGKYISRFDADEREMTKYIIGTVNGLDFPLTPSMKGERAIAYYLSHITQEDIQKEREEVLSTTKEDIQSLGKVIDDVMKQDYFCAIGNEQKIKDNDNIFGKLVNVFE